MFKKNNTFVLLKRPGKAGTKRYELHKHAKKTLRSGLDLKEAVKLPKGERLNDWLAVGVVTFHNAISIYYGALQEFCTMDSCPRMTAGPKYSYRWQVADRSKPPVQLSARLYVKELLDWIGGLLDNDAVFPSDPSVPFPSNFLATVKQIFKRLFRVYAHIYYHHFDKVVSTQSEAELNSQFKHFYRYLQEFKLVDPKELRPLDDLVKRLKLE